MIRIFFLLTLFWTIGDGKTVDNFDPKKILFDAAFGADSEEARFEIKLYFAKANTLCICRNFDIQNDGAIMAKPFRLVRADENNRVVLKVIADSGRFVFKTKVTDWKEVRQNELMAIEAIYSDGTRITVAPPQKK